MLQQEQASTVQADQLRQSSSSDKEILGIGKRCNKFTYLADSSPDTRCNNKDLLSVSYSQPAQCREISKGKAISQSNKSKGETYKMAEQSPLQEAEGGEKINVTVPVSFMGSNLQAGKVSSTTPTQGKDEGKLEKWTDFVSKLPQIKACR